MHSRKKIHIINIPFLKNFCLKTTENKLRQKLGVVLILCSEDNSVLFTWVRCDLKSMQEHGNYEVRVLKYEVLTDN